jgi:hypothetical protein
MEFWMVPGHGNVFIDNVRDAPPGQFLLLLVVECRGILWGASAGLNAIPQVFG